MLPALITLAAFLAFTAPQANATAILELSSGLTTVTITDAGGGDLNPGAGAITFIGTVGSWTFNVTTGVVSGTSQLPVISLNTFSSSSAGSVLTIKFGDTGFTNPGGGSVSLGSVFGGFTPGTVDYSFFYNDANTLFGGTEIFSVGTLSGPSFSGGASAEFTPAATYALYALETITHAAAGSSGTNVAAAAAIPEPGTLFLLGSGLVGLVLMRGRKKFRK